ncbi:steroid 5-alpha-reductase DET2 [Papaver somniferum]|uniref:steroid 5-alpha-reductase DET2 n=1 Tax=Papaver somniferum TaxID=3469 RepID=UPI000E6F7D53|nr:steroid 5-alpha-reductase DET2 [Papaver somniferum]XP_026400658.1 steroid 5-alpha-reductase DET2 [Papaver somniferum]
MEDQNLFNTALQIHLILSPITLLALLFIQAPYGKHYRGGWGPTISPSYAWFLMESPTLWLTLLIYPFGRNFSNPKSIALISVFLFHYIHRTLIYPIRLSKSRKNQNFKKPSFPISVVLMAFVYNLLNVYLQSRWVSHYADFNGGGNDWWFWGRFFVGLVVFVSGFAVNVKSDLVLVSLKGDDGGYKVPKGGMFEFVSCANYFGEIMEWFGWMVMIWSWVGVAFFMYTCSNLVPRAGANHRWYLEKFRDEYPKKRKAVIPFVY